MELADGCISAHCLVHGYALSYTDQPYFAELMSVARHPDRPLVLVAGAGVSMAAGLPSWMELVSQLEQRLVPRKLVPAFDSLSHDDIERKTDTILYLTGVTNISSANLKHLREALYQDRNEPEPSAAAQSIAQLASVYKKRISIVTTNFDTVLEAALLEVFDEVQSYSSERWTEWHDELDDRHRASVMHLHGLVYPEERPSLHPLVLSESDFRQHGPGIQAKLLRLFEHADVLVVGASLSDPNIATPLAMSGAGGHRFVTSTPPLVHDKLSTDECAEVAVWQSKALESALEIKPILLKSYAQVAQLVSECALAAHSPDGYRKPGGRLRTSDSLHYGTRFRSGLESAYATLGASPRDGRMSDLDALALSRRLHELTFKKNGPAYRLNQLRKRHTGYCAVEENIGVFLWLRDLPRRDKSIYGLRLMARSTHAHWKSWSAFRVDPIQAGSRNPAVQAAFTGRALFVELDRLPNPSRTWRGAWAQPLIVGYTSSDAEVRGWPIDQLQLGSVSVLTNRIVPTPKHRAKGTRSSEDISALAVLNQEEMAYFLEALDTVVVDLFD